MGDFPLTQEPDMMDVNVGKIRHPDTMVKTINRLIRERV